MVLDISKMDKATIVKDTINYIQLLRDQERTIQAELIELESWKLEIQNLDLSPTEKRVDMRGSSILIMEVIEGAFVGDKIMVVNLKCSKRRDTIVRLCEVLVSEA
ncbi:putative transcription factor bHLH family [Helianthus debilis subsp. tardiflorus]